MKKIASIITIAMSAGMLYAQDVTPLQGDMDHKGDINLEDVKYLADVLLQKQAVEQWLASNGKVIHTTDVDGTRNLCGDMDASGTLTVKDLVMLVALTKDPSKAKVVRVNSQGQIVISDGSGFVFDPEDDGLIDDGEIIF